MNHAPRKKPSLERERLDALVVLVSLGGFAVLMSAAMCLYPGGNWLDRTASGHRFFANFLCDLTQPVSLSGVRNRAGSWSAQLGMLLFALALAGFFRLLPRHFVPNTPLSGVVQWLGRGAVLTFVLVTLAPSQRFGTAHASLALLAGALGIAGAVCALSAVDWSRRSARRVSALGAAALAIAAVDALLFAYHLGDSGPPPLIVPAAQKIAALFVCAWMIAVAWPPFVLAAKRVSHGR